MSAWRIAQLAAGALVLFLIAAFGIGCMLNADAINQIEVRLKPGVEEPGDHHLLGVGDADKLPDYSLSIRTKDGWEPVGTRLNTSAAQGLTFPVTNGIPFRGIAELRLVEDDKFENDVLEQVPADGTKISGKQFDFALATERRFEAGMEWFFSTPPGKAISLGITLAVFAFIMATLGPILPL
jgi:hypothetical protein